jgi:F-box interacting protein
MPKKVEGLVLPRSTPYRMLFYLSRNPIGDECHSSHLKCDALPIGSCTDVDFKPASDRLKVTSSQSATRSTPFEREVSIVIFISYLQVDVIFISYLPIDVILNSYLLIDVIVISFLPIDVIFISYLQNVSETTYESGYEYTDPQHLANKEQNTVESFHQSVNTYRNTQELGERLHTFIERAQSAGNAALYSSTHRPNLNNSPPNAETIHSDIMFPGSGIAIEDDSESSGATAPNVSIESREPLLDKDVRLQGDTKSLESPKRIHEGHEPNWGSLPDEIQGCVLSNLKYEELFQLKLVCRGIQKVIGIPAFLSSRGDTVRQEGLLTSLYLYVKNGDLQWSGYDLVLKKWRPLPTLRCLPSPNIDLFKDYLVSSGGGLLCANVSSSLHNEELVVCNPMTQTRRVLPPLNFPRNPVLMHMLFNPATKSYKVIVAGSAGMTEGLILSRKTEVFDSLTSEWEVTDDLPGPEFSLNEYQTGVCINGILYCIAFLEDGSGKGVLAYNVEEGKWLSDWKCPLPCPGHASSFSIAQLVECDGEVYLFSEREASRTVEHGIHKLEHASVGKWKNVVKETRTGGRGLLLYPEYACVGFGAGKLCVFNTIEHTGKVYDIRNAGLVEPLPAIVKSKGGEMFHSLNPLSFTFEPNFQSTVFPEPVSPLPEQNHSFRKLTEMLEG